MRLLIALLFSAYCFAATGTITTVAIEGATGCAVAPACNGWVADITITTVGTVTAGTYPGFGLGTNNTPATGTPKLTFTVTSKIQGTSSTGTHIVYGTYWLRQAYPNNALANETPTSNQVVVRVALSDYIYSADTLTANILAGFYKTQTPS